MKKQPLTFKPLEDFKKAHAEHAEKRSAEEVKFTSAKQAYENKVAEYEKTYMDAVGKGKDETAKLVKIDGEIAELKQAYEKASRDYALAKMVITAPQNDTVEIVDKFIKEYKPQVIAEVMDPISERLVLARNLIFSALSDYKDAEETYRDITQDVKGLSELNHKRGLTSALIYVSNPTEHVKVKRTNMTPKQYAQNFVAEYNKTTDGKFPDDYEYIASIADIKGDK